MTRATTHLLKVMRLFLVAFSERPYLDLSLTAFGGACCLIAEGGEKSRVCATRQEGCNSLSVAKPVARQARRESWPDEHFPWHLPAELHAAAVVHLAVDPSESDPRLGCRRQTQEFAGSAGASALNWEEPGNASLAALEAVCSVAPSGPAMSSLSSPAWMSRNHPHPRRHGSWHYCITTACWDFIKDNIVAVDWRTLRR